MNILNKTFCKCARNSLLPPCLLNVGTAAAVTVVQEPVKRELKNEKQIKMKNIILSSLVFLTLFQFSYGQSKEIEVVQNHTNGETIIFIKNNSTERKEVTLNISGSGFEKVKTPIVKLVDKNETIEFVTLKPSSNKSITFSLNYTYISKPEDKETKITTDKNESQTSELKPDLSKGVILFSKNGCSRCSWAINYLNENDIKYTNLNVTENQEYHALMWQKLSENKVTSAVTMPVVIINGKLTHSHKDLDSFLKKLIIN